MGLCLLASHGFTLEDFTRSRFGQEEQAEPPESLPVPCHCPWPGSTFPQHGHRALSAPEAPLWWPWHCWVMAGLRDPRALLHLAGFRILGFLLSTFWSSRWSPWHSNRGSREPGWARGLCQGHGAGRDQPCSPFPSLCLGFYTTFVAGEHKVVLLPHSLGESLLPGGLCPSSTEGSQSISVMEPQNQLGSKGH